MPLGDFLQKIAEGKKLTNEERDQLRVRGNLVDVSSGLLRRVEPTTGRITNLTAGSTRMTAKGVTSMNSALETIRLETDGDAFFGSDLAAPATTSLIVFSNAQTYNSESMGAGDVLLGDNSSSKANVLWDVSDSVLRFRGGTTTGARIETDGTIFVPNNQFINFESAGGGAVAAASIGATAVDDLMLVATGSTIYLYATAVQIEKQAPAGAVFATFTTGAAVFNEDSNDIDFRVESNGDANMLFVDGGADRIGIGTGTPASVLHVLNAAPVLRVEDSAASSSSAGGSLQLVSNDGAAVVVNDLLGQLAWLGHNGTTIVSGATLRSHAGSTWSGTNRESFVLIQTTPSGSTTPTEAIRVLSDQTLRLVSANSWTANGTGTVTISNLAPAGVGTATISKWLTITDNAGVVMYIPAFT